MAACFAYPLATLDGAQSESDGGPATSYSFGDKGVDLPMRFAFPNPSNRGLSLVGDSTEALTRTHWSDVCRSTHLQTNEDPGRDARDPQRPALRRDRTGNPLSRSPSRSPALGFIPGSRVVPLVPASRRPQSRRSAEQAAPKKRVILSAKGLSCLSSAILYCRERRDYRVRCGIGLLESCLPGACGTCEQAGGGISGVLLVLAIPAWHSKR